MLDLQEQVKGALIGALARGAVHGPDRASIREPAATLAYRRKHRIPPRQHLIDRCRELAGKALGYEPIGPPCFELSVAPSAKLPPAPFAVFVHSTSRADKLWPEPHWRSLIVHFANTGMTVLLPAGGTEIRGRNRGRGHATFRKSAATFRDSKAAYQLSRT